jgi:hypothetical protein
MRIAAWWLVMHVTACSFDVSAPTTAGSRAPDHDPLVPWGSERRSFQEGVDSYVGTQDTWIRNTEPNNNFNNSEHIEYIRWEVEMQRSDVGLLRFDDLFGDDPEQIPPSAEIVMATLEVTVSNEGDPAIMREAKFDWNEATTWSALSNSAAVGPGIDEGKQVATAPSSLGPATIDVTASLQRWSEHPGENRGWVFLGTGSRSVHLRSSESPDAAQRPRLQVEFR